MDEIRIRVTLPRKLANQLRDWATKRGKSVSQVVTELLLELFGV